MSLWSILALSAGYPGRNPACRCCGRTEALDGLAEPVGWAGGVSDDESDRPPPLPVPAPWVHGDAMGACPGSEALRRRVRSARRVDADRLRRRGRGQWADTRPSASSSVRSGGVFALVGMACVGSSVAVSQALVGAPLFTVQAVRYALAAIVLLILSVAARRRSRGRAVSNGPGWAEWQAAAWCCSTWRWYAGWSTRSRPSSASPWLPYRCCWPSSARC